MDRERDCVARQFPSPHPSGEKSSTHGTSRSSAPSRVRFKVGNQGFRLVNKKFQASDWSENILFVNKKLLSHMW